MSHAAPLAGVAALALCLAPAAARAADAPTPAEVRMRECLTAAAAAHREVEEDHFGLSVPVTFDGIPDPLLASIRRRRPEADPATLVADGWDDARRMLGQYVEAGLSKFVVRPASPGPFGPFLDGFVRELLPIQN